MYKKINFIFFVIISLFFSITVFAQETKVLEVIKDKITIQPNPNSQSGSLTYKDKIGDTSIYVTPQYDKFGGISSNAGLNYNKKFGDSSLFVQSLIEKITVVLFIGAIHLNPLIRENLELPRVGVKNSGLNSIIEDFK